MSVKISLDELMYSWTYKDIEKANAILDMKDDYDSAMYGYMDYKKEKK